MGLFQMDVSRKHVASQWSRPRRLQHRFPSQGERAWERPQVCNGDILWLVCFPHRDEKLGLAGNLGGSCPQRTTPAGAWCQMQRASKPSGRSALRFGFSEGVRSWGNPTWKGDRTGLVYSPSPPTNRTLAWKTQIRCSLVKFIDNCLVPTHKTALEPQKKCSNRIDG